ncbi:MAG: lipopolysaccharide kinase InaA family protein [Mediterranea sp.]|nr:lipopolysaccharide kinase InaA family protein [Mediterranea sp.]
MVISPHYEWARAFISRLPDTFDTQGELIYQKRNVVRRICYGGEEWVVKRYKTPHLIQRLAYTFWRKGKAERAYLFAHRLLALGVDTPEGIAYIERRRGGLLADSYFLSRYVPYPALFEPLNETEQFDHRLADSFARFLIGLHEKGILHGDLNLDNVMYHTDADGALQFSLIDTNRSHFKPSLTRAECLDNLKRISHRRDLLHYIIRSYARQRGWDEADATSAVDEALDWFERRRAWKREVKAHPWYLLYGMFKSR